VLVASGAKRGRPDIDGIDLPHVFDGDDLRGLLTGEDVGEGSTKLSRLGRFTVGAARQLGFTRDPELVDRLSRQYMPIGRQVVVIGGGLVGTELADFLAERGRNVTVIEEGPKMAVEMAHPRRWRVLDDLRKSGVTLINDARVTRITESVVSYRTEAGMSEVSADNVIVATGLEADTTLADSLRSAGFDPVVIGDAGGVGYIEGAIADGFEAAVALG